LCPRPCGASMPNRRRAGLFPVPRPPSSARANVRDGDCDGLLGLAGKSTVGEHLPIEGTERILDLGRQEAPSLGALAGRGQVGALADSNPPSNRIRMACPIHRARDQRSVWRERSGRRQPAKPIPAGEVRDILPEAADSPGLEILCGRVATADHIGTAVTNPHRISKQRTPRTQLRCGDTDASHGLLGLSGPKAGACRARRPWSGRFQPDKRSPRRRGDYA
jgi:hypothetical protein